MSRRRAYLAIALVLGLVLLGKVLLGEYLDLAYLANHRLALLDLVGRHYAAAAAIFMALYFGTAFFVPGALALTVAGGYLFGVFPTMCFINAAATAGATLAFLLSRRLLRGWVEERFKSQARRFNEEIGRHGYNYLLVLRIVPIIPFFAVNYCAGLSRVPLRTFLWTTSLGVLPGSFIYSYAGRQMLNALSPGIPSTHIAFSLALVSLFILLPVIARALSRSWRK